MTSLARAAFFILVAATFGAFFVAQRLKGAPPIVQVRGIRWFSPNGDGRQDVSRLRLRMRESDVVSVDIIDASGNPVRRLVTGRRVTASQPLRLRWDGRSDDGAVAPDGRYRVRVSVTGQGRSVVASRAITLDTTPPEPRVVGIGPSQIVGPQAPAMTIHIGGFTGHQVTRFRVLRTDQQPAHAVAEGAVPGGVREWVWDGRSGGRPVPAGVYLVQVEARDRAGNVGRNVSAVPPPPGESPGRAGITVRGIAAEPPLRPVTAGTRAEFFVDARRRAYRWDVRRLGARRPVARGKAAAAEAKPLALRAPSGPSGLYLLELRSGRSHTSVPFLVQARERATVLVVVPAITWLGEDPVDDPPLLDGIPDTLTSGSLARLRWPRVFAGQDGLPAGLRTDVAPLLAFLDRNGIRYDLTSDLDLSLTTSPRASDRRAVLLAGSERWVTRILARRLRRFVADGGRVATFGTETLRRGVTLRANADGTAGDLERPTPAAPDDPFGATLRPVRRTKAPTAISLLAGDPAYGLLTGSDGTLAGFSAFEESAPPPAGDRVRVLAGLGEPPSEPPSSAPAAPAPEERYALTASSLGKGVVIRVGLPQWSQRLHDPEVGQVTRNIVDLLRGVRPRIRSVR